MERVIPDKYLRVLKSKKCLAIVPQAAMAGVAAMILLTWLTPLRFGLLAFVFGLAAGAAAPYLVAYFVGESTTAQAEASKAASQEAHWAAIGGGDSDLGRQIEHCRQKIRQLKDEIADLQRRQKIVDEAVEALRSSRLQEQCELYARAAEQLVRHRESRSQLVEEWEAHLQDLEALVVAARAEAALEGIASIEDLKEELAQERDRLDGRTAALSGMAELDQMLADG